MDDTRAPPEHITRADAAALRLKLVEVVTMEIDKWDKMPVHDKLKWNKTNSRWQRWMAKLKSYEKKLAKAAPLTEQRHYDVIGWLDDMIPKEAEDFYSNMTA
jgi:hypothetical protein